MKKLIFVIVLAAAVLFGASFGLKNIAQTKAQEEHLWLMRTLLSYDGDFTLEPYSGEDANIRSVHKADTGYVIETVTYGYAGEINMMIAVNNDGHLVGLVVQDAHETFGLGSKILTDHEFLAKFLNGTGEFAVATAGADAFSAATGTDGTSSATSVASESAVDVDAVTGATVSSKAVVRCVNSAIAYVTGADVVSSATEWGG